MIIGNIVISDPKGALLPSDLKLVPFGNFSMD